LAEQAKILVAEAEENNLDSKVLNERWRRWSTCGLCEQSYHGVVRCALSWACWKTYLGRLEADQLRGMAMELLGGGLCGANYHEDALSVQESLLSTMPRLGVAEENILVVQGNLANSYHSLGRLEEGIRLRYDVYSRHLKLNGEEDKHTLIAALNYAIELSELRRFAEAKSLMCKMVPIARRVLGNYKRETLMLRVNYAMALYRDDNATLDDLREPVNMLEETERTALRVFGGAHPFVADIEIRLRNSRAALGARETPPPREGV